jgi:hypothetical protein
MRVRRVAWLVGLLLAACCLSCQDSEQRRGAVDVAATDPQLLARDWSVRGTSSGTKLILRLRPGGGSHLVLMVPCGRSEGEWVTDRDQQLFLGVINGTSSACYVGKGLKVFPGQEWMERVTGYRARGSERLLVDASGHTLATLSPVPYDRATPPAGAVGGVLPTPAPSAAPLPEGVRSPSREELLGTWTPIAADLPKGSRITFANAGAWNAMAGCGESGRYVLGQHGRILVSRLDILFAMSCGARSSFQEWVPHTGRVGLVGDELVFYDKEAHELGRARRAS